MLRFVPIAALLLLTAACSNSNSVTVEVAFEHPPYEKSWGTLFRLQSSDGRFVCSAGFVNSVQTRFQTNGNDLEFWCRDITQPLQLAWHGLPKPSAKFSQAYIANYRGTLVDATSYQAWTGAEWRPAADILPDFGEGNSVFWQRFGDGSFLHTKFGPCGTYSLRSGTRTFGALPENSRPSYLYGAGDKLIGVIDEDLVTTQLRERPACEPLEFEALATDVGRSYGGLMRDDTVVIGGSSTRGNAALYEVRNGKLVTLQHQHPGARVANEHYSYTLLRDELLVGLYPSGAVAAISPQGGYRYTEQYAPPVESDWRAPDDMLYREMQAAVTAYGTLFGGLYPWGEVTTYNVNTGATGRDRLFDHPEREDRLPYLYQVGDLFTNGLSEYTESSWAQRIPTIAVLNGEVCASTANMGGEIYDPSIHDFMSKNQSDDYGAVYCADLEHQVLYSGNLPEKAELGFEVGKEIRLIINGEEVASAAGPDGMDTADMTMTEGLASYGPLAVRDLRLSQSGQVAHN